MAVVRVGWQRIRSDVLGNEIRPITLTPEVMAVAILAENNKIPYEGTEIFGNGLIQAQIAELNKQGINVANSSYSTEY